MNAACDFFFIKVQFILTISGLRKCLRGSFFQAFYFKMIFIAEYNCLKRVFKLKNLKENRTYFHEENAKKPSKPTAKVHIKILLNMEGNCHLLVQQDSFFYNSLITSFKFSLAGRCSVFWII